MEYHLNFESINATPVVIDWTVCAFNCVYTLKGVAVDNSPLWIEVNCKDEPLEPDFVMNNIEIIKEEIINPKNHELVVYATPDDSNNHYYHYCCLHFFDATINFENKKIKLSRSNISISWPLLDFIKVFE